MVPFWHPARAVWRQAPSPWPAAARAAVFPAAACCGTLPCAAASCPLLPLVVHHTSKLWWISWPHPVKPSANLTYLVEPSAKPTDLVKPSAKPTYLNKSSAKSTYSIWLNLALNLSIWFNLALTQALVKSSLSLVKPSLNLV